MNNLPYDISRCHGHSLSGSFCQQRLTCLRHTAITSDMDIVEHVLLPHSDSMCYNLNNEFSGQYKIEMESV